MPTGYTYKIKDGISFDTFVLDCARAFGACITMRDDSMDTPIPDEFPPSDYYAVRLKEAQAELSKLETMTISEADEKAEQNFKNEISERDRRIEESNQLRKKYTDMLNKVEAWIPPTVEHSKLKTFMSQQINYSMNQDCDCSYFNRNPIKIISGEEWRAIQIEGAKKDIKYHTQRHAEEVANADSRTLWVKQLRESLKA